MNKFSLASLLVLASCHREVRQELKVQTSESHDTMSNHTEDKKTETISEAAPVTETVDETLDVEATPTRPARHLHRHVEKVVGVVKVDKKETVQAKAQVQTERKLATVTVLKTKATSSAGFDIGWKLPLALLLLLAGAAVYEFKRFAP